MSSGLRIGDQPLGGFVHFLLCPENAAPVLVLGNGHPAFNANAYPLAGFGLAGKQLLEKGHASLPLYMYV
jgi:hypothetical protein